ncbi:hypothetical protein COO91_07720 [Nostoc flagelliforme CCNUN1]|uniref:Uncharacterized protein n=1 Tax=Nostoc flagelliforme CCNUN1 TaxID=2038116 RepID=A0A2K8T1U5_9NOSO|nr:hypothetical protein COO91_07720 [Nostoc flagelliforme CCNUN1]
MFNHVFIVNKITLYLNRIFSDRFFFTRLHKIALLPYQLAFDKMTLAQAAARVDQFGLGRSA